MRQITSLLFVSMSFVIPLDYSVVNVGVVDSQPAVMIYFKRTASTYNHVPVTLGLGSY